MSKTARSSAAPLLARCKTVTKPPALPLLVALAALVLACDEPAPEPSPEPAPVCLGSLSDPGDPFADATSFVVLPDTQFYSCFYDEIFTSQTSWLVEQRAAMGIALALHTGDIVDTDVAPQWQVAADALHMLDGELPYVLAPGNHDLDGRRSTLLDRYFEQGDLSSAGGAELCVRSAGQLENSYAIARLRGEPWLFIGLEFGPRDAVLDWANEVLAEHADKPAVLFTHAYLYDDGERYDRAITPLQPYHPDAYGVTAGEGINDGQDIFERVVEPNENVRLVLSGHVIPDGLARAVFERPSGELVHEVLTNYQTCGSCPCEDVSGGDGYLRIFHLDEAGNFQVTSYSPYRDAYRTDPENQFSLPKTAL